MNNLLKIEEIMELLSESGNHLNYILEQENLHQADIDLIKQKVLHMYEIALGLAPEKQEKKQKETIHNEPEKPTENKPKTIKEDPVLEIETNQPTKVEEISKKIKAETAAEIELNTKKNIEDKKNKLSDVMQKQSAKKSLNDQLSQNRIQTDLSKKLQTQPITDIHKAIDINDRFLFVKELFDGDQDLFSQTLHILNQQNNFNEAYVYLRDTFQWNMDLPVVQQLLNIMRRKLIKTDHE